MSKAACAEEVVLLQETGALTKEDSTLEDGRRIDLYGFSGKVGQTVGITLESIAFDPQLVLVNESGGTLAQNDDIEAANFNAFVKVVLPENGIYRVAVLPAGPMGRGMERWDYRLTVVASDTPEPLLSEQAVQQVQANQLLNQAARQYDRSQFQDALQNWKTALAMYQVLGDRQGEADSLGNLGNAYDSLGQFERAIDYFEQTLAITRDLGDRQGEANSLGNLGNVYDSLGQYRRAINLHQQSLPIHRDIGDQQGEVTSLLNLGAAHGHLNQFERSIEHFQQALTLAREIGSRDVEGRTLNNLGNVYSALEQHDKALEMHRHSLEVVRDIGDRQGEAMSLMSLGTTYANHRVDSLSADKN